MNYNIHNSHARDSRINFDEASHTYTYANQIFKVTAVLRYRK